MAARAMSALRRSRSAEISPKIYPSVTNKTSTRHKYRKSSKDSITSTLKRKRSTLSLLNAAQVEEGEDDVMVSGWGEAEDMKEDLLKDWGEVLDKWDGKQRDKARPKQLSKLCRKVSQPLNCCFCQHVHCSRGVLCTRSSCFAVCYQQ